MVAIIMVMQKLQHVIMTVGYHLSVLDQKLIVIKAVVYAISNHFVISNIRS